MKQAGIALLAAATLIAAVGCGPDPEVGKVSPTIVGPGDQYVALGDSFTSAPSNGPAVGPAGCLRTSVNYPHLVAEATGVDLEDRSCGGATTLAVSEPQATVDGSTVPPQLDAAGPETDLVTFSLAGNNYSLYARIVACTGPTAISAPGTPCADADAASPQKVPVALEALASDLATALQAVRDKAPHAVVLVIGYPQIVPEHGTCDLLPLAAGDYAYARSIFDGINQAFETAADQAGATYVDVATASAGHDVCSASPWIAGSEVPLGHAITWHPYPVEQQAVADLVVEALRR